MRRRVRRGSSFDVLNRGVELLAQDVTEPRGVQSAAEADDLLARAVAGLVEVAVQEVNRVRGGDRNEVVVVLGQRGADVLHDGCVVAREVDAGLSVFRGIPP